ncbi:MAG: HipA N-terminal domain-containing protein [Candidatus Omnitrophota bacterium]
MEEDNKKRYVFEYSNDYSGEPVSLTMPVFRKRYVFDSFPPFFDGLLPEGVQLEALCRIAKLDRNDCFSQLVTVGKDLVGAVTAEPHKEGDSQE